jgi:hypothetical protein
MQGPPPNPLFVPALLLLVLEIFWALYVTSAVMIVLSPTGYFQDYPQRMKMMMVSSYVVMLLTAIVSIGGPIAMLNRRWKWLAWTGCVLALVPMFGPCGGLALPLGIWCLALLRRPDVNAGFAS